MLIVGVKSLSKFTTELRFICENVSGFGESRGYADVNDIVKAAAPKIFNFSYPIFDESYKQALETKILKHFYTREIGVETYGLWKLRLDIKMNEIMPYYNQLYNSALLKFNPFYDVDLTTDRKGKKDENRDTTSQDKTNISNTSNTTSKANTKGTVDTNSEDDTTTLDNKWDYYSDTPQGDINGITNKKYLTNARNNTDDTSVHDVATGHTSSNSDTTTTSDVKSNGDTVSNGTENVVAATTDEYLEHVVGKRGSQSYATLLRDYRKTFLNIDMMVIEELDELFIGLWE